VIANPAVSYNAIYNGDNISVRDIDSVTGESHSRSNVSITANPAFTVAPAIEYVFNGSFSFISPNPNMNNLNLNLGRRTSVSSHNEEERGTDKGEAQRRSTGSDSEGRGSAITDYSADDLARTPSVMIMEENEYMESLHLRRNNMEVSAATAGTVQKETESDNK
jgi:hypothetical protein